MHRVQIKGVELAKVIRNAQLWQEQGVSLTEGRALLSFSDDKLTLYSTDGYTAMKDSIEYNEELPDDFTELHYWFTEEEMEVFLAMAVAEKSGPLLIDFDLTEKVSLPYGYETNESKIVLKEGSVFFGEPTPFPEWLADFEDALDYAEQENFLRREYEIAMRPERLVKFFRVRTDKAAPVDFKFLEPMNPTAGPMAAVKIGYTFRALVNFVNRETAKKNLTEEQQVFMW